MIEVRVEPTGDRAVCETEQDALTCARTLMQEARAQSIPASDVAAFFYVDGRLVAEARRAA